MKKFEKIQILKNIGSSWFALGLNVLVGIFLSPYILHRLGDEAFGLWVLIFSVTGYYGLFDLGIRSSIIRYVAKFSATEDHVELNRLVNTAILSYSCIGFVVMAITFAASFYVDSIFRIPPEFLSTARLLFLLVGSAVAVGFPLGVFGGILEALQRFYLLNFTSIGSTLVRAILIVVAIRHGKGLLTVALVTVSLPIISGLVNAIIVFFITPIRIGVHYLDWSSLRRIANYGGATFIIIVATKLRFKSDAVVIGTFISSAAITYFNIGSRLVDYASEVVSSMAQIFVPMSSQSEATGDMHSLRKLFIAGNRACALIIFPIAAILLILGKSVIEAWVGARYVAISYPVMLVLLLPSTLMLAQAASGRILFGMAKHKAWAWIVLVEGISNLVLSVALVRRYGIMGDALGTAIPLLCTQLFFLPRHLCRLLGMHVKTYLRHAFSLPLALTLPLIATLMLLRHWFVPHNYIQLGIQLLIGLVVYGIELLWAIWTGKAWRVDGLAHDHAPMATVETLMGEA